MINTIRLPVITIYQPWAQYIIKNLKTIETRLHDRFKHLLKGKTILIHASKIIDQNGMKLELIEHNELLTQSAILGSAYVYDCKWLTGSEYENKHALVDTKNKFGIFLTNIKAFDKPIFINGKMGIWYYDIDETYLFI